MSNKFNNPEVVCRVEKSGVRFNAFDTDGNKRNSEITTHTRKKAFNEGYLLGRFTGSTGKQYWRKVDNSVLDGVSVAGNTNSTTTTVEVPTDHAEVLNFIHSSYSLKPQGLMMNELKWK